jgi:hypothetical protein
MHYDAVLLNCRGIRIFLLFHIDFSLIFLLFMLSFKLINILKFWQATVCCHHCNAASRIAHSFATANSLFLKNCIILENRKDNLLCMAWKQPLFRMFAYHPLLENVHICKK